MPPEPTPPPESSDFREKRTYLPPRLRRSISRHSGTSSPPAPSDQIANHPDFDLPRQSSAYQAQTPVGASPAPDPQASPYDFMMASQKPAKHFSLPGANASLPIRILLGTAGVVALLIIFVILKGFFGGGPDLTAFVTVAQDQQELLHLTGNIPQEQQQGLSVASQNFAATAQAAVNSSQAALIQYIANNGTKIKTKDLNRKVSSSVDNQLQAAIAASTYDQTFQQIMQAQLTTYMHDLSRAYDQTKGPKGRALLSGDYKQAQLLTTQLTQSGQ